VSQQDVLNVSVCETPGMERRGKCSRRGKPRELVAPKAMPFEHTRLSNEPLIGAAVCFEDLERQVDLAGFGQGLTTCRTLVR